MGVLSNVAEMCYNEMYGNLQKFVVKQEITILFISTHNYSQPRKVEKVDFFIQKSYTYSRVGKFKTSNNVLDLDCLIV